MCMIIDGMTQKTTQLPHWVRRPSWVDTHEYGTHVIGSIIEGLGIHLEFSYTENIGDSSNVLIDNIQKGIKRLHDHRRSRREPLPEVLYLQLDNTTHNKSKSLFTYLSWLLDTGIFKKVKVNYLLVGHTHEIIDQVFSRYSVALRKVNCLTLAELMEVAKTCYTPNPTVEHVQSVTNWLQWFQDESAINETFCDMTFNHAFRIKRFDRVESSTGEPASKQVVVHSKQLGWRPSSNDPKAWKPSGGVQALLRTPEGQPEAQELFPLDPKSLDSLRRIVQGFMKFFGEKYTGDMKAFWDHQVSYQESIFNGNRQATGFDYLSLTDGTAQDEEHNTMAGLLLQSYAETFISC